MGRNVVRQGGEMRNACNVLIRIYEIKWLFGRPWYKWEDNIKLDLKERGVCGQVLIGLV
jgi:hypothetical protein